MKKQNNCQYFCNSECEYFPCHKTNSTDNFNCIFCYCPLYSLEDCGGNFKVLANGTKDCSDCLIPHSESGYEYILKKLQKK